MEEGALLQLVQERLASGNPLEPELEAQLQVFFAEMRPRVVRLCCRWAGDLGAGEELAHDALAEAWKKLPELPLYGSFTGFVFSIARNKQLNQRRRISERLTEDGVMELASEEGSALHALRAEEQEELLLRAIAGLPQQEQDAVYWKYFHGLSVDEITLRLGLTNSSGARSVLQNAKRHLQARLRQVLQELGHGSSFFRSSIS
jgi:RNA polymerase sigma factor (sigma-70 family)